jgi:hypothetical protein
MMTGVLRGWRMVSASVALDGGARDSYGPCQFTNCHELHCANMDDRKDASAGLTGGRDFAYTRILL